MQLLEKTRIKNGKWYGLYLCDCGNKKEIRISAVNSGGTISCGCKRQQNSHKKGKRTHNKSNTKEFKIWSGLKQLCNPNCKKYKNKTICQDWLNSFEKFDSWYQLNKKPGYTIFFEKHISPETCEFLPINESKRKKTSITSYEKYNADHPTKNKEVIKKVLETKIKNGTVCSKAKRDENCLKKYGVTHWMKTEKYKQIIRQKLIDRGLANNINGKTGAQLAKELKISPAYMNFQIRKCGKDAAGFKKHRSLIEIIIQNILDKHNIKHETKKLGNYFPDFIIDRVIIECDGLYWHSDKKKHDSYHKEKRESYISMGYSPLFFREDEIIEKSDIIESIILNKLGMSKRVFARKCQIKEIDSKTAKDFFKENHLMGAGSGSGYGLFYAGELVSAMSIVKSKIYNISRFAHKKGYNVIGGFSKILNQIDNDIQTFIDLRYGSGDYLSTLGFTKETEYLSFYWTKDCKRVHRLKFPGNSGYNHGYSKIWDCGQSKWIKYKR